MSQPEADEKLTAAIPGATVQEVPGNPLESRFVVLGRPPQAKRRASSQLAHGSTRREAIDRAIHLFGDRNR